MKNIAKPVNPAKVLFLCATLNVGMIAGCTPQIAKQPALKPTATLYWKYIAERKDWTLFDATGKARDQVTESNGLYSGTSSSKRSCDGYWTSSSVDQYDTLEHAEIAAEKRIAEEDKPMPFSSVTMGNMTFSSTGPANIQNLSIVADKNGVMTIDGTGTTKPKK